MEKKSKKSLLNFYKNKTIFITGINGFKGSWLYLILKTLGAKVYGIDKNKKTLSLFSKYKLSDKNIYKKINIKNFEKLNNFTNKINPDLIFHMASESLVFDCYEDPLKAVNTNLDGLSNLLYIYKKKKLKKKISLNIITSDKCYLPKNKKKYIETDELGGNDIYSATKACQEILTKSFYESYFKKNNNIFVNTFRAGNVIGGGDYSKNRLIPDIYRSRKRNKKIFIRNKHSTRPWQYVIDCLHGYLLATKYSLENDKHFDNWNFAPNHKSLSVKDLIELVIKQGFITKDKIKFKKNPISETKFLNLNQKKVKKILKWKTSLKLDELINETFDIYNLLDKKNTNKEKVKLIEKKIKNYFEKIYGNSFWH